jgi:hypothetical protein
MGVAGWRVVLLNGMVEAHDELAEKVMVRKTVEASTESAQRGRGEFDRNIFFFLAEVRSQLLARHFLKCGRVSSNMAVFGEEGRSECISDCVRLGI